MFCKLFFVITLEYFFYKNNKYYYLLESIPPKIDIIYSYIITDKII